MSVRLPLQLGRAALNQGARFAATVWWFPFLLVAAAMLIDVTVLVAMPVGFVAFLALSLAVDAAGTAKRDRPADIVLDETGFVVEGGPLDQMRCTWAEVDAGRCEIIKDAEPRVAVRWLILSWLTLRKLPSFTKRVRVPVAHLQLSRKGKGSDKLVLAEVEGGELSSLTQLRDSIRGAVLAATGGKPARLPQEILRCARCQAPQVPTATATMTCPYCASELDVPDELRERVHASVERERASVASARSVRKLVDQPSARRAGFVIAWCRRLMVWSQPAALILLLVITAHQNTNVIEASGIRIERVAPSDDGVALYDLVLLAFVVASAFGIAWSVGHAYVANRQALRVLADHFGAVPPVTPGAPSSCRLCGAPLPASTRLLVHCVYCSAENVLGVDPRPAALRREREQIDLGRGLRRRRRARLRLAIVVPLSALLALWLSREVRLVWDVPGHGTAFTSACGGYEGCGTIANASWMQQTVIVSRDGHRVAATIVPHGAVAFHCGSLNTCTVELGAARVPIDLKGAANLRIEHGELQSIGR